MENVYNGIPLYREQRLGICVFVFYIITLSVILGYFNLPGAAIVVILSAVLAIISQIQDFNHSNRIRRWSES